MTATPQVVHMVGPTGGRRLVDTYGRPVTHLRVSVTQRCDHRCFFCHREGETAPGPELPADAVERVVRKCVEYGVHTVKLTGGEPLTREDIVGLVRRLAPLVGDLSMTTNGSRLAGLAGTLRDAGLTRVNVSLHTLSHERHRRITGVDDLDAVLRGVRAAVDAGLSPVKLNMTVMRSYNDDEIPDMLEFSAETDAVLQLIELQPFPTSGPTLGKLMVPLAPVERVLSSRARRVVRRSLHGRKQYAVPTGNGEALVEVVRPHHNSVFCANCTRLRVTSDGKLRPCLLRDDNLVDVSRFLCDDGPENATALDAALDLAVRLREPYWKGAVSND